MTYDETWESRSTRRWPTVLAIAALALAIFATIVAAAAYVQRDAMLRDERAARRADVARLQKTIAGVVTRNERLISRLSTAEQTLRRRETGIAPLAARVLKSVFTVETDTGLGSGFVAWQEDGASYLITAHHVVDDVLSGSVTITRKKAAWRGEIVALDEKNDLALIRINGAPAHAKPLWQNANGSGKPDAGDQLLLVGSPFGLYGSVTTGIVSRVGTKVIQTDAAANPGNSGGPALDKQGRIVGVLVSGGAQNVNFAIRIDRACLKLRDC
jgi:S1-C subfamily serine protease